MVFCACSVWGAKKLAKAKKAPRRRSEPFIFAEFKVMKNLTLQRSAGAIGGPIGAWV
jgi:hypothetical protein